MKVIERIDGFTLKIIACISMFIDHFAIVFLELGSEEYKIARIIGRLAFPIFAFLLVEGFFYTSNLKRYGIRLFLLGVITEPFFDVVLLRNLGISNFLIIQNVVFTLLIGLIMLWIFNIIRIKYQIQQPFFYNIYGVLTILTAAILSVICATDYSIYGIILFMILYLFHENRIWRTIACIILIFLFGDSFLYQIPAIILLYFYNGKEGKKIQTVFYLFFPLHLFVLGVLQLIF